MNSQPAQKKEYLKAFVRLYYLLIHADGHINEMERLHGSLMIEREQLNRNEFETELSFLKGKEQAQMFDQGIEALKKLDKEYQLRCIAWLCIVANADGFMDKKEWTLIYSIYSKRMQLTTEEIMSVQARIQKEINAERLKYSFSQPMNSEVNQRSLFV